MFSKGGTPKLFPGVAVANRRNSLYGFGIPIFNMPVMMTAASHTSQDKAI